MSVCKQTPKKNVQLVNCPSENTAYEICPVQPLINNVPFQQGILTFQLSSQKIKTKRNYASQRVIECTDPLQVLQ